MQSLRAVTLITAFVLCGGAIAADPVKILEAKPVAGDVVIAKVNGAEIFASDLVLLYQELPAQYSQVPLQQMYPQLLSRLIDRKLLADAGRKAGLLDQDATIRRVQYAIDEILQESFARWQVDTAVTDAKLRKAYDAMAAKLKGEEEVEARHILLKTRAEAEAVITEIAGGADFVKLAGERSLDPSKSDGGMLGFFQRGQMAPPFEEAAFRLKPGEVSKAPVQSEFGWHVIKLTQRRAATAPTFEAAAGQLRSEQIDGVITGLIAGLRKSAKIEEFPPEGLAKRAAPAAQ